MPSTTRSRRALLLAGLAALAVVAGCAATPSPAAPPWDPADPAVAPLVGTTWALVAFGEADPTPATRPTLSFRSDGVIEGRAWCNNYGGHREYSLYRGLPGGGLRLRYATRTAAACRLIGYEDRFLDALEATAAYRLAGGQLALTDGGGRPLLTFASPSAAASASPGGPRWDPADPAVAPLVGTTWLVAAFGDSPPTLAGAPGATPPTGLPTLTVSFRPDGSIQGRAACSTYGAPEEPAIYRGTPGGGLRIHPGLPMYVACGGDSSSAERQRRFFAALSATAAYRLEGGRLTLLDGAGQALLALTAVSTTCTPTLVSPAPGATLDNGRDDNQPEPREWEFRWSACPAATGYRLYVIRPTSVPIIDRVVSETVYRSITRNTYIGDRGRLGWGWRVRAQFDEQWGPWSETRPFDVEPVNTDPPAPEPGTTPGT